MYEEATSAIVAGAWAKVFTAMEIGDQKSNIFRSKLPDHTPRHRFARRCDFIESFANFTKQAAQIPEDTINTGPNLWPIVMQKNLYLLGLDHDVFLHHDRTMSRLIHRRNSIAHGGDHNGFTAKEYEDLESAVFKIMDD